MEKQLPLASSNFVALRVRNQIYVDKTDLIYQLANTSGKIFLSRPRRFGKSLLVSTFETLFRDGLKWFDGLKIANLWNEKQYKVVSLDLSSIKENSTIEAMTAAFESNILLAFSRVGFTYTENKISPIDQIKGWMLEQEPNSFVLLVDEYDAPLNSHLHQLEFFEQVRSMLSNFFLMVKSVDMAWRFVFLTGIAKFNKASIFSAFNNLTDISLSPKYSTLLGYTEEEILHYFGEYIEQAARVCNMTVSQIMDAMREQYDGFCFDDKASTHVYAPWSVLSFLNEPESGLRNFWYDSAGQPSMIINYLGTHDSFKPEQYDIPHYVSLDDLRQSNSLQTLSDDVLMFQAGYLTIKQIDNTEAILGYPNREVASAIASLAIDTALRKKRLLAIGAGHLRERLSTNNPEDIANLFNAVFLNIDYQNTPITSESACRAIIQVLLLGAGLNPIVEQHNALGRSDLELTTGGIHWVFEFKFLPKGKSEQDAPALLEKALQQIQNRKYGKPIDSSLTLIRMAMVFSEEQRQVVLWKTL